MKYTLIISPRAERDIRKARDWYEAKQAGLGQRLVGEIEQTLRILERDAHRFPLYYKKFRRMQLPRFPYRLFFVVENQRVLIFRILHAKRDHPRLIP